MAIKNFAIRSITGNDLDAVVAIELECYPHPWSLAQFLQELENPVATILVCEDETGIVGFICYWLIVDEMQILNLATAPSARRNGVAAQLLEHTFNNFLPQELASVWLEVRSGNRAAITLYQRFGFVPQGTRRAYYRDGEDALLMVKKVLEQ
ncbi:MAG: ribosomal protein S18-alanine N-acetyltransferase [Desulfuromonadales bacterium]|nr:ribosomal protein S18-alanine N-acetyltransferase [Desulfuromonadales bacterium]